MKKEKRKKIIANDVSKMPKIIIKKIQLRTEKEKHGEKTRNRQA